MERVNKSKERRSVLILIFGILLFLFGIITIITSNPGIFVPFFVAGLIIIIIGAFLYNSASRREKISTALSKRSSDNSDSESYRDYPIAKTRVFFQDINVKNQKFNLTILLLRLRNLQKKRFV